jgi:hypothetical protein
MSDDEIRDHLRYSIQHGPCEGLGAFFKAHPNVMICGTIWPDGTHTSELIECPVSTAKSAPSESPAETSAKSAETS